MSEVAKTTGTHAEASAKIPPPPDTGEPVSLDAEELRRKYAEKYADDSPIPPALRPFMPMIWVAVLFLAIYGSGSWGNWETWTTSTGTPPTATLPWMVFRWLNDPSAAHGFLIIPIAGAVAYGMRRKLKELPFSTDFRGLIVMAIALLMHLTEALFDINGPSPLSIPFFLAGAVWYCAGTAWLRALAFPLAYLLFMVPIPGSLNQFVSFPLRLLAHNGSKAIVHALFGIDISGASMNMEFWRHGADPTNADPDYISKNLVSLVVADPCSGLHSLMAIKALHAITAYMSRLKLTWKWVLFWCALPISLVANVCRMVLIILVCTYIDKGFGLKAFHDYSPYLLFLFVFGILFFVGLVMEYLTGAYRTPMTTAAGLPGGSAHDSIDGKAISEAASISAAPEKVSAASILANLGKGLILGLLSGVSLIVRMIAFLRLGPSSELEAFLARMEKALAAPSSAANGNGFAFSIAAGIGYYVNILGLFWVVDMLSPKKKDASPPAPIDPANYPYIILFLAVIGLLMAVAYAFGRMGSERAEAKGYPAHFGFLMCFYFGPIGLFLLKKMEVNTAELEWRARATAGVEQSSNEAVEDTTPWTLEYKGKRPNFNAAYILLGIALGITLFLKFQPSDDTPNTVDLKQIPVAVEGWKYQDVPESAQSADLMQQIKADSYLTRYYQSPSGQIIELYVIYRRYGRREFNHNPDKCFPAGGWQMLTRDITDIPYAGEQRKAVTMLFDGKGVVTNVTDPATGRHKVGLPPATVTYFFASGDRTEYDFMKQQMWMALERILPNKNGWAMVRMTTIRSTNDADALAAQKEFLRVYGPGIQKVITTDTVHSKMAAN